MTNENDPGVKQWTTWTTEAERVKSIVLTDGEPRSARGIAEEAVVGADRTREILNDLVEDGVVTKSERNSETRYAADRDHMRDESIRMLREANDSDELRNMQEEMMERLNEVEEPAHERLIAYRLRIVGDALTLPDDE